MTKHARGLKAWRTEAGFAEWLFLKTQVLLVQQSAIHSLKEASGHLHGGRVSVCLLLPSGPPHFYHHAAQDTAAGPAQALKHTHAVFLYWKGRAENLFRPYV